MTLRIRYIFLFTLIVTAGIIFLNTPSTNAATLIPVNLTPTTSLSAETSNNTSAYSSFPGWPNSEPAAGNVSKVNIHTLLYSGNTTKIFAHLEPWFCTTSPGTVALTPHCMGHVQNGLNESSAAVINAQIADMASRGIDGIECDFYGVGYSTQTNGQQQACDNVAVAAQATPNFSFVMQEDDGSWKWRCDATTNPTGWKNLGYTSLSDCIEALMKTDLSYFNAHYYSNPAYYHIAGRPMITFFVDELNSQEPLGSAGWATLWSDMRTWAATNGNPLFVFENSLNSGNAFWSYSDGTFGWPQTTASMSTLDWQMGGYIPWFYNSLAADSSLAVQFAPAFPGFNDTIASWTAHRITDRQCGQTWLNTFAEPSASGKFGTSHQLQGMLISTWNDYEEGTEIESGIDNCLSISANVASTATSTLSWNVVGATNTLDHYTIYISTDAQHLAVLADNIAPTTTSLDLSKYNIAPGNYSLYVKAVGKPSITNHMSNAASFVVVAPVAPVVQPVPPSLPVTPTSTPIVNTSTINIPPTSSGSGNAAQNQPEPGSGIGNSTGTTYFPTTATIIPTPTSNPVTENTTPGNTAILQSLMQQVLVLIAQLNAQLVSTFTRPLTIGSVGADVKNLQMFLNDNGYPVSKNGPGSPGNESSHFGPATAAAVARFQAANGLPATGYFGKRTEALLSSKFSK